MGFPHGKFGMFGSVGAALLGVLVGYQLNMANLESSQRAADGQAESWDMYSCSILAISDCLNLMLELPWLMTRNPYQPQNESRRGIWIQTVPQVYYNLRPNYQWMMTPMEIHISHHLWGSFRRNSWPRRMSRCSLLPWPSLRERASVPIGPGDPTCTEKNLS